MASSLAPPAVHLLMSALAWSHQYEKYPFQLRGPCSLRSLYGPKLRRKANRFSTVVRPPRLVSIGIESRERKCKKGDAKMSVEDINRILNSSINPKTLKQVEYSMYSFILSQQLLMRNKLYTPRTHS